MEKWRRELLAAYVHGQLVALHRVAVEYNRAMGNPTDVLMHSIFLRYSKKAEQRHLEKVRKSDKEKPVLHRKWYFVRVTVLALLLIFTVGYASAQQPEVKPGAVVATDRAILCADLESAKKLADTVGKENIEAFGQGLLKSGACAIAAGIMQVKELSYQGKTFNVIHTHDNAHQFYWVTIVKVKGTEV